MARRVKPLASLFILLSGSGEWDKKTASKSGDKTMIYYNGYSFSFFKRQFDIVIWNKVLTAQGKKLLLYAPNLIPKLNIYISIIERQYLYNLERI